MKNGTRSLDAGIQPSPALVIVVLLIGLRLDGVIDWPWVWVLAPIWGVAVLVWALQILIWALERPKR